VTALHIGPLHPLESVLVLLLALGPLVAAVVVVLVVRRREALEDDDHESGPGQAPADSESSAASVPPSS
jgi:hypothetical protein